MADVRIPYSQLLHTLQSILLSVGFSDTRAQLCAELFGKASLDGVASHGLNRFPHFMEMIKEGYIDVHATPRLVGNFGFLERWDGQSGPGNLNAYESMKRAIFLSKTNGIGCVSLRNTNHWM